MAIALPLPQHGHLTNSMADDPFRLVFLSMIAYPTSWPTVPAA
jgi:hypothetical protein